MTQRRRSTFDDPRFEGRKRGIHRLALSIDPANAYQVNVVQDQTFPDPGFTRSVQIMQALAFCGPASFHVYILQECKFDNPPYLVNALSTSFESERARHWLN
ncbi:hypothetical protein PVAG01_07475 [Phlyctema vagabunda]|uniref:Uncharacterized protein n=1 Tax=Phlyctema vagabunda TaxID=108571 RepID=A0ABR4PCJ3_9HELO